MVEEKKGGFVYDDDEEDEMPIEKANELLF
jgi:hypothetical protein